MDKLSENNMTEKHPGVNEVMEFHDALQNDSSGVLPVVSRPCVSLQPPYSIIYADPPWNYSVMGDVHGGRAQNKQYDTMRFTEICELPIAKIGAGDSVLFLWATYPMLPEAMYLVRAWGYKYKTVAFTWVKMNRKALSPFFGMGHWTRTNAEICLLGVRGNIKREDASVSQIIFGEIDKHSRKPAEVREKIVQLMGDKPRIELFARQRSDGWATWGNEVESDIDLTAAAINSTHGG